MVMEEERNKISIETVVQLASQMFEGMHLFQEITYEHDQEGKITKGKIISQHPFVEVKMYVNSMYFIVKVSRRLEDEDESVFERIAKLDNIGESCHIIFQYFKRNVFPIETLSNN